MKITIEATPEELKQLINIDQYEKTTDETNDVPTVSLTIGGKKFS
ncbi:hypothetical protein [Fructobacillus cardui]|nr:hypothetical protein [Fructobacillus cardui]